MNFLSKLFGKGKAPVTGAISRTESPAPSPASGSALASKLPPENIVKPVHIDFESYEPVLQIGDRTLANPCTFLVTVNNPSYRPMTKTCRVMGTNHKLSPRGVVDGVVAHVNMVQHTDDAEFERVYVQLLEDGRVVGQRVHDGVVELITDLSAVYFMPGDTTWLDAEGNPLPPEQQPRPLPAQKRILEEEQEQLSNPFLNP